MSLRTWWRKRRERAHRRKVACLLAKAVAAETRATGYNRMFEIEGRFPSFPGHWVQLIAHAKAEAAEYRTLAHHYAEEVP